MIHEKILFSDVYPTLSIFQRLHSQWDMSLNLTHWTFNQQTFSGFCLQLSVVTRAGRQPSVSLCCVGPPTGMVEKCTVSEGFSEKDRSAPLSLADFGLCVVMSIRPPFSVSLQRNQATLAKGWQRISAHMRIRMNSEASLEHWDWSCLAGIFFSFSAHLYNELNRVSFARTAAASEAWVTVLCGS